MHQLPQTIGAYRLETLLGRGGVGAVYRAVHLRTGQLVALKTLQAPVAAFLPTLRREVAALARLRHPGIVRILDSGSEEGMPWVAMELVEGATLRRHVQELEAPRSETPKTRTHLTTSRSWPASVQEPAPPLQASFEASTPASSRPALSPGRLRAILTMLRRICAPLAYLHGEGLVHRDLKPENILVRPDRTPVLVDFGLSAEFAGRLGRESLVVDTGASGTLRYMAPEQLQGRLLDARADLYSLGCILYELLTGGPPFRGPQPQQVAFGHLHTPPRRPSELVEGLPGELDELVLRLLAKEPRLRLGHADDVASSLARMGAEDGGEGPRARPYLYRPGLAGRDEVLRGLEARLEPLQAGGGGKARGGLVLLGGESGVGKSRLALELGRRAERRGMLVLTGECLPAGVGRWESGDGTEERPGDAADPAQIGEGAEPPGRQPGASPVSHPPSPVSSGPLHPLRRPLQAIADRCRGRGLKETERLLGRRGKLLALYEPALSGLPGQEAHPEPVELPAEAARLRLFGFLTETFEALAQDAPLVLLLDDLHWADELTLGWLEHLLCTERLASRPLLLLATYRSEEVGITSDQMRLRQLLEAPGTLKLRLDRLEDAAVGRIVADMLALEPPPAGFVRFLARHSEGNPFFVAEYLRVAISESVLYRSEGLWQVAEPGRGERGEGRRERPAEQETIYEALPLPRSLGQTVERRLRGLSAEAQHLAEAAAVLGRETDEQLLLAVAQADDEPALEAIEELRVREVLEEATPGRLRFAHDKLREVAYERMDPERRRELHCTAAGAIEITAGAPGDEPWAILGHHWEQAGVAEKARTCYLDGARRAVSQYAHAEAERMYRSYLQLVEEAAPESVQARNELGWQILFRQGRNEEGLQEHARALEEARSLLDRLGEVRAAQYLCHFLRVTRHMEEARSVAEQGLETARQAGILQEEGRLLLALAMIEQDEWRFDRAPGLIEQALAAYRRCGDLQSEGVALGVLANGYRQRDRLDEALALYERANEISSQVGDRYHEAVGLGNVGSLHLDRGALDLARTLCERSLALHRQFGNHRGEGEMLAVLGDLHLQLDRMQEAQALQEQALAIHRETGDRLREATALGDLAVIHGCQGEVRTARALFERASAIPRRIADPDFEAGLGRLQGTLERRAGDPRQAGDLLRQAENICRRVSNLRLLGLCLCEQGHLALARGELPEGLLKEAQSLLGVLRMGPQSEFARSVARLQRAMEAFEAGWPLFRGERWDELPEGLRRWLLATGQAGEPFSGLQAGVFDRP
jgi:serine/threonine protein kinase/predicted ATPase